jgi:hypothetical protein
MTRFASITLLVLIAACSRADDKTPDKSAKPEHLEFFEKKIRPVLVDHCYKCHSVESGKSKGGLFVDSKEGLLKGGTSGPAVIPGDPESSLLLKAIRHTDDELEMPPKEKLSAVVVSDFETWIKLGASDPRKAAVKAEAPSTIDFAKAREFWSFQAPKDIPPPAVKNKAAVANPIDSFVVAKLEEKGLKQASLADKRTLIRRATFDLIGLPPKPEEVEEFLRDQSPNAFERLVDRLLASPHYGERWGRHWLDVARYADTAGESADYPAPHAFRYRNWVINAFNQDKPYDQFVREQIAGDLMPYKNDHERFEQIIATGYVASARRFSVRPESVMHLTIEDTIDTIGRGIMGLTLSCARCHDHKFDPIPTRDYYSIYGFFASTRYPFPGSENDQRPKDLVPLVSPDEYEKVLKPHEEKLRVANQLAVDLEKQKRQAERQIQNFEERKVKLAAFNKEIEAAKKTRTALELNAPNVPMAYALAEGTPKDVRIQRRGEPGNQGDDAPRGFLQIFGGRKLPPEVKNSGRLELAQWITDLANPLTARVMVNRIWQHHFGKGIVTTPSDFGKQGKAPSHPELLDYLALRFVENGWSIKSMHKLMMLSRTYQLASEDIDANMSVDPENSLLWKHSRSRLDAEIVRDAMLAVSGDLDPAMAQGHPFPPEHKWNFTQHSQFQAVYETNHRSIYLMSQRIKKHPFLAIFDGSDPNTTTGERLVSTTPLQALFMMNDPFAHKQAELFAGRLIKLKSETSARIEMAYQMALGRPASKEELSIAERHLAAFQEKLMSSGNSGADVSKLAMASLARALFACNEFIYVD